MQIRPLGDTALIVSLGDAIDEATHRRVQGALAALEAAVVPGVRELVPAYSTITLYYDPAAVVAGGAPADEIVEWMTGEVGKVIKSAGKAAKPAGRKIEIPVCYGGEHGPDLARVAQLTRLSEAEVIKRHAGAEYLVYLVGFAPGFPYLGELPKQLVVPRLETPRTQVAPGSVGIAGLQTGIYPLATPGGWNLIGRTPKILFDVTQDPPALLRAGDRVQFRAIDAKEFNRLSAR